MKKLIFTLVLSCFSSIAFGQSENYQKLYGGEPTASENMVWHDAVTPNEKYEGVIQIDSSASATRIIEAFMATFQPLQDANIMTKQMRTNSAVGGVASAMSGDIRSMEDFSNAGDADARRQYQGRTSWTVQFIDGVRLIRFYYNVSVQAKDGRYKLTVTPAGLSGYANDHIQTEWSQLFRNGKVKSMYSKSYGQMRTKLAFTTDQWITAVEQHLLGDGNDDW
jgi:hypothetical protein